MSKLQTSWFIPSDLACRRETVMTNEVIDELKEEVANSLDVSLRKFAGPSGYWLCCRTGRRKSTGVLKHSKALLPLSLAFKCKQKESAHVSCLLNNSYQWPCRSSQLIWYFLAACCFGHQYFSRNFNASLCNGEDIGSPTLTTSALCQLWVWPMHPKAAKWRTGE